jgi:hypothetical protein
MHLTDQCSAFFDKGNMAELPVGRQVANISDFSFSGYQYNFNRSSEWLHDDSQGWGASDAGMENIPVAGNTFSFPYIHGKALRDAGYSFVSMSDEAFELAKVKPENFSAVDMIFGEERGTGSFNGRSGKDFRVYTPALTTALRVQKRRNVLFWEPI